MSPPSDEAEVSGGPGTRQRGSWPVVMAPAYRSPHGDRAGVPGTLLATSELHYVVRAQRRADDPEDRGSPSRSGRRRSQQRPRERPCDCCGGREPGSGLRRRSGEVRTEADQQSGAGCHQDRVGDEPSRSRRPGEQDAQEPACQAERHHGRRPAPPARPVIGRATMQSAAEQQADPATPPTGEEGIRAGPRRQSPRHPDGSEQGLATAGDQRPGLGGRLAAPHVRTRPCARRSVRQPAAEAACRRSPKRTSSPASCPATSAWDVRSGGPRTRHTEPGPVKSWKILRDCRLEGGGVHHAMLGVARLHDLTLAGPIGNALPERYWSEVWGVVKRAWRVCVARLRSQVWAGSSSWRWCQSRWRGTGGSSSGSGSVVRPS